jgi:hypothetical protein
VSDRVTLHFSADGRVMGSIYTASDRYISIAATASAVTNFASYNLYRNGAVIKSGTINSNSWNFATMDTVPASGEYYYFVRLLQTDFDRTWSSPIWATVQAATGVPEGFAGLSKVELLANHPNPFHPITTIDFTLPAKTSVDLSIYDATGRRVRTLARGERIAGPHSAVWDGTDENGRDVAAGVYLARLETPAAVRTQKMVLLK